MILIYFCGNYCGSDNQYSKFELDMSIYKKYYNIANNFRNTLIILLRVLIGKK